MKTASVLLMILASISFASGQSSNSVKLQSVEGSVTVNGRPAVKGMEITSESSVTTAARSSAVVSLGKLGRVEVLPESTMKLSFSNSTVSLGMLDQGRVRVSSSSNATVTTRDGQVLASGDKQTVFFSGYDLRKYFCCRHEECSRIACGKHGQTNRRG